MKIAGIYKITCLIDGKFYIGGTSNWTKRKYAHWSGLDSNVYLQDAIKEYGIENFQFEIIEEVPLFEDENELKDYLLCAEQDWLDKTECWRREIGYNVLPFANGSTLGLRFNLPKEAKEKISIALKGRRRDEEHSKNISAALKKFYSINVHPNKGRKFPNRKRTNNKFFGENNNNAKLTWDDVIEIRNLYADGGFSMRDLSKMFKISKSNVDAILKRKSWSYDL